MTWYGNPTDPAYIVGDGTGIFPRDFYDQRAASFPAWYKLIIPPGTFHAAALFQPVYYLRRIDGLNLDALEPTQPRVRANAMTINSTPTASCAVSALSVVEGETVIFALCRGFDRGTITWPAGFTERFDDVASPANLAVAWHRAGDSEPDTYTATWTDPVSNVGGVYVLPGAIGSGDPTTIGTTATGSGTAPDPPSVDPGSSDARIAIAIYAQSGAGATRFTAPAGYTVPASDSDGGTTGGAADFHCGLGLSFRHYVGQVEDPPAATSSVAGEGWITNTIVLDPGSELRPQPVVNPGFGREFQSPRRVFTGVLWETLGAIPFWTLRYADPSNAPLGIIGPGAGDHMVLEARAPFDVAADILITSIMYWPVSPALRLSIKLRGDYDTLVANDFEQQTDFFGHVADSTKLITVEPYWL